MLSLIFNIKMSSIYSVYSTHLDWYYSIKGHYFIQNTFTVIKRLKCHNIIVEYYLFLPLFRLRIYTLPTNILPQSDT